MKFTPNEPAAVLIDVRTKIEHDFASHPFNAVHIPWKEAIFWQDLNLHLSTFFLAVVVS